MKKLLAKIRKILRDRRTRRFLTRLVSGVAAIVVFVTTYALVLPAITMEKEANCGIEAHQHDDSCYTEELVCDIPESDAHHHGEICYSTKLNLICETAEHEHSPENGCYDEDGNLTCDIKEHQHNDECFEEVRDLICEIPESDGHHHTDDCYKKVLTCGKEPHVHSTACYEADPISDAAVAASTGSAAAAGTSADSVSSAGMTLLFDNKPELAGDNSDPTIDNETPAGDVDPADNDIETETDNRDAADIEDGAGDADPADNDTVLDNYDNDAADNNDITDNGSTTATDGSNETALSNGTDAEAAPDMEVTYGSENAGTGTTEAANAALTNASNSSTAAAGAEAANQYIPPLDPIDFITVLNNHTGIYYHPVADGETVEDSSAIPAEDWKPVPDNTDNKNTDNIDNTDAPDQTDEAKKNKENNKDNVELGKNDLLRVYLSYTLPAGSLNATNPVARYRLPSNLHLTDPQVKAINENVNGVAAQYVDMSNLEITDPDKYNAYLGLEAVEGTRTPDKNVEDYRAEQVRRAGTDAADAAEYISAVVRVENVYDTDGIYGDKDAYLGQDLIFTFTPYSIDKNQHEYDSTGQPTKAGKKIEGWLTIDFNMGQVDWSEPEITTSTVEASDTDNDEKYEDDHSENESVKDDDIEDTQTEDNHTEDNSTEENHTDNHAEDDQNHAVTKERAERTAEIVFVEEGWDEKGNVIDKINTILTMVEETVVESQNADQDTDNEEIIAGTATENADEAGTETISETVEKNESAAEKDNTTDPSDKGETAQIEEESEAVVVMPAMSFADSIKVTTGRPAGIDENAGGTLANAADALPEEAEVSVRVEADEGTFPIGTTMVLKAVSKKDMAALAETVTDTVEKEPAGSSVDSASNSEDRHENKENQQNAETNANTNIKTYGFQAVDITFLDKDGNEIEPAKPVRVALTSEVVEQVKEEAKESLIADPVVVHVDDNGNAEQMELVSPEEVEPAKGRNEEELLQELQENEKVAESGKTDDDTGKDSADDTEDENDHSDSAGEADDESNSENNPDAENKSNAAEDAVSDDDPVNDRTENDDVDSLAQPSTTDDAVQNDAAVDEDKERSDTAKFTTDSFSVYAIVYTVELYTNVITDSGETYRITVTYDETSGIPQNAELKVKEIKEGDKEYDNYFTEAVKAASATSDATDKQYKTVDADKTYARFFDIEIWSDGQKIEPAGDVSVSIRLSDIPESDDKNVIKIVHFDKEGPEIISYNTPGMDTSEDRNNYEDTDNRDKKNDGEDTRSTEDGDGEAKAVTEFSFTANSFSVYSVVSYTVDFHWEVDGKMYDFSLPGGGFVSFTDLVEVLGITGNTNSAENEAGDTSKNAVEADEDDLEATPLTLDDVVVSEGTREFVENVENVAFSSPELVWVGKINSGSTVGELKEDNGLEVKYSADLTEEQVEKINAQTVQAGDWALISVQPFKTEETLTVTMKTGEAFTIQVTDAQISTHVITADGEDYIITVIYGPEAEIPDDAVLEAEEIVEGSEEYEKYVDRTREALTNRDTHDDENTDTSDAGSEDGQEEVVSDDNAESIGMDGSIVECTASEESSFSFARFFDIRIMAGEEKIEPKAPVTVKISYADAVDVEEGEELLAVHFAKDRTELISVKSDEESKELTFVQGSFSVTGTVVNVQANNWPDNGNYVLFTEIDGQYYAIDHDGNLVPVTRSGNNLSFEDADVLFHGMDEFTWTYQYQSNWMATTRTLSYTVGTNQSYLNPANENGIGGNRSLERNNERIRSTSNNAIFYITTNADHSKITGQGNEANAIPIYFAQGFNNKNKVIVHFVDRNGNPISGVTYNGNNSNVIANPSGDGTFAIPYDWGGATGVVDLSKDFSKTGYTYASTHLSGVQGTTTRKQDGLTIDAKLTERNNGNLYIGTDIGSNQDYYSYSGDATTSTTSNNQSGQRSLSGTIRAAVPGSRDDYATTTDKDIYVILDPSPNTISGGENQQQDVDADDPIFSKTLEDNGDGTYTLSLTIEGHAGSISNSPKANVLFVVDTSSSMHYAVGNSTRIKVTHDALKKLGDDLMAYNQSMEGRVEVSMITFDGSVYNRLGWTDDQGDFDDAVDTYITHYYMHRGTDWEDALKEALVQANTADSDPTFVIFFTDGEPSQYTNYHGAANYDNTTEAVSNGFGYYLNSFLCRESSKDEARALVDSGYQLYGVFAFNDSGHTYPNGATGDESDSELLHNLLKYGYNTDQNLGADSINQRFFPTDSQDNLERAFDKILESINISVGFDQVEVNDSITDLTQAGFTTSFESVNQFSYYRSGKEYGTEEEPWEVWENAPQATPDAQNNSVKWELKNPDNTPMVLEDGVSYRVSFLVWPKQASFDWVTNLANGTKTWDDVVAAGLDFPNGADPQIVRTQTGTDDNGDPVYSYSIATNKPSKDENGNIINNQISYRKKRTEILKELPEGVELDDPVETTDENGNTVITTYTQENGVITKTVVTTKTTSFDPPEPMGLNDTKMNVKKEWEDSINLGHRADYVIFNLLVDGQPYMARTNQGEDSKKYEIRVEDPNWLNEVVIAPGVIKDGDVLEVGHSYTISEKYDAQGSDFYNFSFEFKSQTVRPMNIDGDLVYLVEIDADNPAPSGASIHAIDGRTYYETAGNAGKQYYEAEIDTSGKASISGTNGKTSELDITKIVDKGNTNLKDSDLDAETFTYRITLDIPEGSNINGIMGYCYFEYPDRPGGGQFKLFGYQPGETALASDIARFGSEDDSKKIYRSWNTTNDRIKSQLMKTNGDGSITIKMDLTLTQKEVLRLTNLPSGTTYEIEEVYANYYKPASPSYSEEGQKPLDGEDERPYLAPNLAEQGYSVTQILEKNSNQSEDEKVTHTGTTVISGSISETNTRYYNQYTNELTNVTLGELKVTKHLEGYEWSGEKYYFTLTAGTADYNDGKTPETGISPMPASNRIYLSDASGTADKTYTFGKIRYTRPGTYQYTITETDADGNVLSGTTGANGIFYAPADTVTVTVGYDDDEHLAVKKIEGSNGNTIWSTTENSAVVTGTTTFTNSIPVPVKKMDIDKKTQLSNAVFELLCGHSKLYFDPSYMILTQAQVESIINMAVNDDGAAEAMAAKGITSTFTIGEVSFKGLSLNTTYTLKEIQPPDGYIIATNEVTFTLSRDDDGLNISVTGENASVDEDGITIIITNEPGVALPNTGGHGTTIFYLLGLILTGIGCSGIVMRRKRRVA